MSVRAIAAATGVSKSTVDRDLAQVPHDGAHDDASAPESTVPQRDSSNPPPVPDVGMGHDGKVRRRQPRKARPKREPKPTPPEPAKAERKVQIPTEYRDTVKAIEPLIAALVELTCDSRWSKAIGRFNFKDRSALDANIATLQNVRDAMGELYNTTSTDTTKETA